MTNTFVFAQSKIAFSSLLLAAVTIGCSSLPENKSKDANGGDSANSENGATEEESSTENPGFTPTDNDPAAMPADVAGSFLTSLSCIITNQADSEASDTAVTCKLQDKRGDKFGGSVTDVKTSIVLAGSTKDVPGIVSVLAADSSDTFVAIFPGVSPQSAIGIEVSASLDGNKVTLQSPLLTGSATASISDKDLYVSASADPSNSACTKEAPCKSIRRALFFVPDIIGHKITVHVTEGTYQEIISITGKTIRNGGNVTVQGVSTAGDGTLGIAHLSGSRGQEYAANSHAGVVTLMRNTGNGINIRNLEVESCMRTGIDVVGSTAVLSNIKVVGCQNLPDEPALIRPVIFIGLSITFGSEVQILNGFTIELLQLPKFVPNVPGATCSAEMGPITDTCKRLSSIGISVADSSSSLEFVSGMIKMVERLDAGIKLLEFASFAARNSPLVPPTQLHISNATRAIGVFGGAKFRDNSSKTYPTQDKRLSVKIDNSRWGVWADNGNFEALFADIEMGHCSETCLHAANEGRITIGRDSFAETQPVNIVSKVGLNTVPAEGQNGPVVYAGFGTRIAILPTVEDMTICHMVSVSNPVIEANFESQVFLRIKKEALTAMINRSCAIGGLGAVKVNQGSVSVIASSKTQTFCGDSVSLESCIGAEVAKN